MLSISVLFLQLLYFGCFCVEPKESLGCGEIICLCFETKIKLPKLERKQRKSIESLG